MLVPACERLIQIVLDDQSSAESIKAAMQDVTDALADAAESQIGEAVRLLATTVAHLPLSAGNNLLIPAVGMIQSGAQIPAGFVDALALRVAEGFEQASRFPALWGAVCPGDRLPDNRDPWAMGAALELALPAAETHSYSREQTHQIIEGWFVTHTWAGPLRNLMQRKEIRQNLPHRDRLAAATSAVLAATDPPRRKADSPKLTIQEVMAMVRAPAKPSPKPDQPAWWMRMMLSVLDDEQLVVIHRDTRRGFRVTVSGIGDNGQLDTLLADCLIRKVALTKVRSPRPEWVAAATDGDPQPAGGIAATFHMTTPGGASLLHDDVPADIPLIDGQRVLLLSSALVAGSTWERGRLAPFMRPAITVNSALPPAEVDRWLT